MTDSLLVFSYLSASIKGGGDTDTEIAIYPSSSDQIRSDQALCVSVIDIPMQHIRQRERESRADHDGHVGNGNGNDTALQEESCAMVCGLKSRRFLEW